MASPAALVSIRISGRGLEGPSGPGTRTTPSRKPEGRGRPSKAKPERPSRIPGVVLPRHVQHCAGTGSRDWWIYVWDPKNPALVTRTPYMCNSWRCSVCRRHEASIAFARTKAAFEAIEGYDPRRLGFFVLTLDRDGYYSGEAWKDEREAYAALSAMARKFLKRLRRLAARDGIDWDGRQWVATVEAHKSGWPHYQLLIYLPAEWVGELPTENGFRIGWSSLQDDIRAHAQASGWGKRSSFERARDEGAAVGYLIDTAGKHEHSVGKVRGELLKLTQLPTNAPARFRRLRSAPKFLPPRVKGTKTGTMVRRRWLDDGTPHVEPLHEIKDPTARSLAVQCCYQEMNLWSAENQGKNLASALVMAGVSKSVQDALTPKLYTWAPARPRGPPDQAKEATLCPIANDNAAPMAPEMEQLYLL